MLFQDCNILSKLTLLSIELLLHDNAYQTS